MEHDVIVDGAGPAGSTVGYELSRRGFSVLVLEKEMLPRDKLCADAQERISAASAPSLSAAAKRVGVLFSHLLGRHQAGFGSGAAAIGQAAPLFRCRASGSLARVNLKRNVPAEGRGYSKEGYDG